MSAPRIIEWNVYADNKYIGTVHAKTESEARLAAWATFDLPETANLSVNPR